MRRRHTAPVLGLAAAFLLVLGTITTANAQTTDRIVLVGTGESGYAVNLFGPAEFTIATGSTVTFHNPWFEPHTVTFTEGNQPPPPPHDPNAAVPSHPGVALSAITGEEYVNSGFIWRDESFQATFPEAGAFDFFCIIHPGMQGTVTVAEDATQATPQAQMDSQAQVLFEATLNLLRAEAGRLMARTVSTTPKPDGTTTWSPVIVGGMVGTSDVQQFFPPVIDIQVGDTIVFESHVHTPHTVSFMGGPPPFPPDMQDPFDEPTFLFPFGPAEAFAGDTFLSSGVIGLDFPAGLTFEVTFTQPGSYPYICLLHADQDMVGVVNVTAAAPPPAPAPTGSDGSTGAPGMSATHTLVFAAALALLMIALGAIRRYGVR